MNHSRESFSDLLRKAIPIFEYRGVIVERVSHGYSLLGTTAKNQKEVDIIIDDRLKKLEKSIVK